MTDRKWWISVPEAREVQNALRGTVVRCDDFGALELVAGIDVGVSRELGQVRAAAALFSLPDLELVTSSVVVRTLDFPYIPGYLSFRELPAALAAIEALARRPDMLLVDGHGLAHPRRFGIACHLGVAADLPAIGIGKSRLIGHYHEPANRRGAWTPLHDRDPGMTDADAGTSTEVIGAVLRTRVAVKPVFVSVGHRVSLTTAVSIVMQCTGRYRLPETTRAADRLAARR